MDIYKAAIKVLPMSPIKTFAGLQLNIKKAEREPTITPLLPSIFINGSKRKIDNIEPATIPSKPSIKFVKFITVQDRIIKNIIQITEIKILVSGNCKLLKFIIKKDAKIWKENLRKLFKLYLSSISPIIANKKQLKNK